MKRTQIYLDEEQDRRLGDRADATGSTKSHLIREAIDGYLDPAGAESRELERFRAAVHEAAGAAPYLPPGKEYVESLRAIDTERQRELERRLRGK